MFMRLNQPTRILTTIGAVCLWCAGLAHGQTATGVQGLYYTGLGAAAGSPDPHWNVTYASTNGGSTENMAYVTSAYVSTVAGGWMGNTGGAQWITAVGGPMLPGSGTGINEGIYVYTLAFQITGTGSGTVSNHVSISLSIAGDDNALVYVNPAGNGATLPSAGSAAVTINGAWTGTVGATLQNFNGSGGSNNSQFKIGTNYLVVVIDNTNSQTGTSPANNATGLMIYDNSVTIDTKTYTSGFVPEVGTWLPVLGALGLCGWGYWRRRAVSM
jgi:hypothetical protein